MVQLTIDKWFFRTGRWRLSGIIKTISEGSVKNRKQLRTLLARQHKFPDFSNTMAEWGQLITLVIAAYRFIGAMGYILVHVH